MFGKADELGCSGAVTRWAWPLPAVRVAPTAPQAQPVPSPGDPVPPASALHRRVLQNSGQAGRPAARTDIAQVQGAAVGTGHRFVFSCPGTPRLYRVAVLSAQKESLALYSLADKALSHTS